MRRYLHWLFLLLLDSLFCGLHLYILYRNVLHFLRLTIHIQDILDFIGDCLMLFHNLLNICLVFSLDIPHFLIGDSTVQNSPHDVLHSLHSSIGYHHSITETEEDHNAVHANIFYAVWLLLAVEIDRKKEPTDYADEDCSGWLHLDNLVSLHQIIRNDASLEQCFCLEHPLVQTVFVKILGYVLILLLYGGIDGSDDVS